MNIPEVLIKILRKYTANARKINLYLDFTGFAKWNSLALITSRRMWIRKRRLVALLYTILPLCVPGSQWKFIFLISQTKHMYNIINNFKNLYLTCMERNCIDQNLKQLPAKKVDSYLSSEKQGRFNMSWEVIMVILIQLTCKFDTVLFFRLITFPSQIMHSDVIVMFSKPNSAFKCKQGLIWVTSWEEKKWALTCDFQQCGILTSVDSDGPVKPPFKLRISKWCSVMA